MNFAGIKNVDDLLKFAVVPPIRKRIEQIIEIARKSIDEPGRSSIYIDLINKYIDKEIPKYVLNIFKCDPNIKSIDQPSKYSNWIFSILENMSVPALINFGKDPYKLDELNSYLDIYDKNVKKIRGELAAEIKNIKSFDHLEEVALQISPEVKTEGKGVYSELYNKNGWLVIYPKDHAAAIEWGKNTNWCTASKTQESFNNFKKYSPLSIIINTKTGNKWQTDPSTKWFNDKNDDPVGRIGWLVSHKVPFDLMDLLYKILEHEDFGEKYKKIIKDIYEGDANSLASLPIESLSDILHGAAENGSANVFEKIYKVVADNDLLKHIDDTYTNVASVAAKHGNLNVLKHLVEKHGYDLEHYNMNTRTVCRKGYLEIVKYLIEQGIEFDIGDLGEAAENGHLNIIRYLETQGVEPNNSTLTSAAHKNGSLKTIKFLLDKGIKPNKNFLLAISRTEHTDFVKNILDNYKFEDHAISSGFVGAVVYKRKETIQMYIDKYKESEILDVIINYAFPSAIEGGDTEIVELLSNTTTIPKDILNNATKEAVSNNNIELLKYLVNKGAVPPEETLEGAIKYGANELAIYLLKIKVKVSVQALTYVLEEANPDSKYYKELLTLIFDNIHYLPEDILQKGIESSNYTIVEIAVEKGAKLTQTLLNHLIYVNNSNIIKLLLPQIDTKYYPKMIIDAMHTNRPSIAMTIIHMFHNSENPPSKDYLIEACKARFNSDEAYLRLYRSLIYHGMLPTKESLIAAVEYNIHIIAELLLKDGIQPTYDMLERARANNYTNIVALLSQYLPDGPPPQDPQNPDDNFAGLKTINQLTKKASLIINKEIASELRELARLRGDIWKSTAYTTAAEHIEQLDHPITDLENFKELPGVGEDINVEIQEFLDTGKIRKLERLKTKAEKSGHRMSRNVALHNTEEFFQNADILELKYEICGSLRRKELKVKDVDVIILYRDIKIWKELAEEYNQVSRSGDQEIDFEMNGVEINLRGVEEDEWGAGVLYFTGPNSFSVYMRKIAKENGYKLNRHGLFDSDGTRLAKDEEGIFKALDLDYVEPESR